MQIKDALKFDNCKNLIPSRASKLGTQPATYFDKSYYFNQWENVFIPTSSNNSETYGSKVYWRLLLYLCIFLIFQHQTTLSPVVQGSNLPKLVQSLKTLQEWVTILLVWTLNLQFQSEQVDYCFYYFNFTWFDGLQRL